MLRYAIFLSRCLVFILTLTFIAPSFAWDAMEAVVMHDTVSMDHSEMAQSDSMQGPAEPCMHPDCHDGMDEAIGMTQDEPCPENHHHCCPGHQLGHLHGAVLAAGMSNLLMVGSDFPALSRETLFRTRVPAGLERPPRFSIA